MKSSFEKKYLITALMFLFLIFGGTLWSILSPDKEFSQSENRYLELMPELSVKSLLDKSFMEKYEKYISDQFFLRNQWVALKTDIERLCLKEEANGVYFGKDGYLIAIPMASDYESEFCKKNTEYLKDFIEKETNALGSSNVKALFVPTSSQVLSEKLPYFASPYNQEILLDSLEKSLPEGTFLSMLPVLKEHSSEYIYYRTDHHWTTLGAYYAYESWAKNLGLTPCTFDYFNQVSVSDDFQGTLQSKLNLNIRGDKIIIFEPKEAVSFSLLYNENPSDIRKSLYDSEKLETKGKYDIFLGGNQSSIEISTSLPGNSPVDKKEGTLLIIKDSFANSFIPFAALHFDNTCVIDLRYFNRPLSEYMEEKNITDVLLLYSTYNFVSDTNFPKLEL